MTLGIVVIGRNEGDRLVRCLASLPKDAQIVYVDSGSSDESLTNAKAAGAHLVSLDLSRPFTAARARNAGRMALSASCKIIQFIDGDCTLNAGWISAGQQALAETSGLAAVFGRRREVHPEASIYNWMCDVEWAVPAGDVSYFGGDVLIRAAALDSAGGYPDEMIAGEEPDLAIRMRAQGWRIACLPQEMTLHDAAILHVSQWWRRAMRSGHAYAELAARHRGLPLSDYGRRLRRALAWGFGIPIAASIVAVIGLAINAVNALVAAGFILLLPLAQIARLAYRNRRRWPLRQSIFHAFFLTFGKTAQSFGAIKYWYNAQAGNRSQLIEYKSPAATSQHHKISRGR